MGDHREMEIPASILRLRTLTAGEKITLTTLYRRAHKGQMYAWPSNRTIAEETAQTISAVQKHILKAERMGIIKRREGPGGRREIVLVESAPPTSEERCPTSEERCPHLPREHPYTIGTNQLTNQ